MLEVLTLTDLLVIARVNDIILLGTRAPTPTIVAVLVGVSTGICALGESCRLLTRVTIRGPDVFAAHKPIIFPTPHSDPALAIAVGHKGPCR